ncbi:hypothetical protein SESBI_39712 [Sesbania bispinosa]|nr:hypothetical protein SESBI_39712 [Sesbania bispinosa]
MNANFLRNLSFHARRFRLSPFNRNPNPTPSLLLTLSPHSTFFFSSRSDQPNNLKKQEPLDDVEDISNEELKRRVARLREGDEEAIPPVFEAILQRYLTGKPIEEDQELMREILGNGTRSENDEEDEFDSDLEGMSDTDYEDEDTDLDSERNK